MAILEYTPQHIIDRYNEFIKNNMTPDEALYIVRLMFELNFHGFERYVSWYFKKIKGYKTKVIGCLNDKGIDIEGSKFEGHKEINLAVQCKKWTSRHIHMRDMLEFDHNAKIRKKTHIHPQVYFITTTRINSDAKNIAKENGIGVVDCHALLKMKKYYGIDDFQRDATQWNNNGKRLFTDNNVVCIIKTYLYEKTITHRIFQPVYC